MIPTRGRWRIGRSLLLGGTVTTLTASGHVVGGGSAATGGILAWLAVTTAWAALVAGRRWSRLFLITAVVVLQLAGHVWLSLSSHEHGGQSGSSAAMLLAHIAAGLGVGWFLAEGEELIFARARRLAFRILYLPAAVVIPRVALHPLYARPDDTQEIGEGRGDVTRRGPPRR